MIDRFEKFSFSISELYYYLHKITRDEMEEYGLNGPHAIYFFILYRHKDGLTCAELSEKSFRNKSDVSRAMTLFEEKGLAVKKGGTKNYRAKISLTEKGVLAAEKLRERAKVLTELISSGVSEKEREILYSSLDIIASNMSEICDSKELENK